MVVPFFSSELSLVADDGDLRITGPQPICYSLMDYLQRQGLTTGVFEIINKGTDELRSIAAFEAQGKTGDEVKELIEALLTEKNLRASTMTIRNPPHGFEVVFHLVDVSVFRPN